MRMIVVGTDGSLNAAAAVREAASIAKRDGAKLNLVAAYGDNFTFAEAISSTAKRQRINLREVAESVLERVSADPALEGLDVMTHARDGDPADAILDVAEEMGADLIVVGARGATGVKRFLLGSVSSKIAHHARCSFMVVREQ